MTRFDVALRFLLDREGRSDDEVAGDVDTSWGITQPTYDAYRDRKGLARRDVDQGTADEFREIYEHDYWTPGKCEFLPVGLDALHFDSCVNHGVQNAGRMMQEAMNMAHSDIDGWVGPKTLAAVAAADPIILFGRYVRQRLALYIVLAQTRPLGKRSIKGWLHRIGYCLTELLS